MKTIMSVILLLVLFTSFASAERKSFTAADAKTVYVQGNNKTANDIRKQMAKDSAKGRSCLAPTNDPNTADFKMQVEQQRRDAMYNERSAGAIMLGSHSPTAITVTDRAGVDVFNGDSQVIWDYVYRRMLKQLCAKPN